MLLKGSTAMWKQYLILAGEVAGALQEVAFSTQPYSFQHSLFLPEPADGQAGMA